MGRYSLKVNINNLGDITIKVPDMGVLKEKVSLMAIDAFTIGNKPRTVLKDLDFSEATLSGQNTFYISYISNGKEKRLDPIFTNIYNIKEVALKGNRKISTDNSIFIKFIEKEFLPVINEDNKFIEFLQAHNLINLKLQEWLSNYISDDYDLDFSYSKLLEYASDYKQFRGLVLGLELYQGLQLSRKQVEEPVIESKPYYYRFVISQLDNGRDPDREFGLFSEEELRKFGESLDALPCESDLNDKTR